MRTVLRVIAAPLVGLAVAIALLVRSYALDEVAQAGQLGPGFWPRLVLLGLAVACVAKLVIDLRARRPGAPALAAAGPPPFSGAMLVVAVALLVAYVLAVPVLGFAFATAAFVLAFMWIGGARSPVVLAATSVLATLSVLYVFVKVVYLPLPKGAGALETATIALYRALGIF